MNEMITDQADVRLHELYVPEDQSQHSDLLHVSLCKALYEITVLRASLEELKAKLFDATACLSCDLNYSGAPCTCTTDKKGYVGTLRARLALLERVAEAARNVKAANEQRPYPEMSLELESALEHMAAALSALTPPDEKGK